MAECEPPPGSARPFIIYTAGRSRTAWLAALLSYRDCRCHFERLMLQPTMAAALELLGPGRGSAETAAAPLWRAFDTVPNLARVVVRRPAAEIIDSLAAAIDGRLALDWVKLKGIVADLQACLEDISAAPGTLTVEFKDLNDETTCAAIFERCLPYAFDREWWRSLRNRKIEVDAVDFLTKHSGVRMLQV